MEPGKEFESGYRFRLPSQELLEDREVRVGEAPRRKERGEALDGPPPMGLPAIDEGPLDRLAPGVEKRGLQEATHVLGHAAMVA